MKEPTVAQQGVNTTGDYDGILFLLFVLLLALQFVGRVWERFGKVGALFGPARPGMEGDAVGVLAIIVLVLVVQRKIMSRIIGARTYDIARAAVMAAIGGVVLCCLCLVVAFTGLGVVAAIVSLGFLGMCIFHVFVLTCFGVGGCWAGWRFGKWGYLWGAAIALLVLATVFRQHLFEIVSSFSGSLLVLGGVIAGVLGGRLGAARFQRTLKDTPEKPRSTAQT